MPEVGDKISFIPSSFHSGCGGSFLGNIRPGVNVTVCGTVTEVHEDRRWYRVEYETSYGKQHECFKY